MFPWTAVTGGPIALMSVEGLGADDVAGMHDEVAVAQSGDARVGQPARAARQVGVGDEGDEHDQCRVCASTYTGHARPRGAGAERP